MPNSSLFYQTAERIIEKVYRLFQQDGDLWFRNSTDLGYSQFPMSDLDVTLFFEDENPERIQKSLFILNNIRRVIPWLSEINIYTPERLEIIAPLANPLEASRDRRLLKKISPNLPRAATTAETLVYLLRMMLADRKHLSNRPQWRRRKWGFHASQTQKKLPDSLTWENLLPWLRQPGWTQGEVAQFNKELTDYLPILNSGKPAFHFLPQLKEWSFIPTYLFHQLAYLELWPEPLEIWQGELILAQVHWEICGCLSQKDQLEPKVFQEHLKNLGLRLENLRFPSDLHPSLADTQSALRKCLGNT